MNFQLLFFQIYVNSEEASVDLFQLYGAQTHIGRYAALVMDKLFTIEEITTITIDELVVVRTAEHVLYFMLQLVFLQMRSFCVKT